MRTSPRFFVPALRVAAVAALALFVPACEEDGDSSLGSGHDFGDNDRNLVVAIGDSITRGNAGWDDGAYPQLLGPMIGKTVINGGIGGAQSSAAPGQARSALGRHPGFLIIFYGAVDVIFDRNIDDTIRNLRAAVQAAKGNKTIPIVATCLPQIREHRAFNGTINQLNPRIAQMASEEGAALVDLNSSFGSPETLLIDDGLHPNAAGQQLIATLFADIF